MPTTIYVYARIHVCNYAIYTQTNKNRKGGEEGEKERERKRRSRRRRALVRSLSTPATSCLLPLVLSPLLPLIDSLCTAVLCLHCFILSISRAGTDRFILSISLSFSLSLVPAHTTSFSLSLCHSPFPFPSLISHSFSTYAPTYMYICMYVRK